MAMIRAGVLSALIVSSLSAAVPCAAQTEAHFQALNATLTAMGFEPKLEKNYVSFTSAQNFFHGFTSCGDDRMNSYVPLTQFPTGHAPASALAQALTYNNEHTVYFSLNTNTQAKTQNFVLNVCYDPEETDASYLQTVVGGLERAAMETREIWDPTRWK